MPKVGMFPSVNFGVRLKEARLAAGLTQVELAKRAGVSQPAISELERGNSKAAHSETMIAIANALNLSPEWLTTGKGERHPQPATASTESPAQSELLAIFAALPAPLQDALLATARSLDKIPH